MTDDLSYPDDFVDMLEIQWGDSYLSPGGPQEVLEILRDVDVAGKRVLDIGCGVAGPAIAIAQNLQPERVIGIDIEPQLIERGQRNVEAAGLGDLVDLQLVQPGPLPFPDASFDLVFSKDSIIHITEKEPFFREVLRVLKPGGMFAASDWLAGEDADNLPDYIEWRALSSHSFTMYTGAQTAAQMEAAGFAQVSLRDRNDWYAAEAMRLVKLEETEWRDRYLAILTPDEYKHGLKLGRANAMAAVCGGLRPTHLFGHRARA